MTLGFTHNPASQIVSATRSNDLYTWTGHGSGTTSSTADGLNRLASHGAVTPTYDARGNLTFDGTYNYAYSSENLLKSFGPTGNLAYDPLMRFYENYSTYFIHDSAGSNLLLGEYYNGNVSARTVPGPGVDEPLVNISKTGVRSWYHADERGSIIAWSDSSGARSHVLTYADIGYLRLRRRSPFSFSPCRPPSPFTLAAGVSEQPLEAIWKSRESTDNGPAPQSMCLRPTLR